MSPPAGFAVNGRFLLQPVTGVQRYARQVITAMDREMAGGSQRACLLAPAGAADPGLATMPLKLHEPLHGHAWEQLTLPLRWPDRLLSLCNTAPALKTDQVVCIHDASVFSAPYSYSRAFRTFYSCLQPHLVRRAARITTVSHASAREISRHLPVRASDIEVLPNGHEHALAWRPSQARIAVAAVAGIVSRGRSFVLAIGSHARHKNLELLRTIAPQLQASGIDIVVAGAAGHVFAGPEVSAALGIHLLGRTSDDDLAYLMEHACALVFPSWTEGFGLPIVEAMARGLPVVSSDRASMPEICGDAALMAAPDDPAAWLRSIRLLRNEPHLRDDLRGRGHERVRLFSWTSTGQGYVELMKRPAQRLHRTDQTAATPGVAVMFATLGRAEILTANVRRLLERQTLKPAAVILSVSRPEDAGMAASLAGVRVVTGSPGLPAQRNRALEALPPGADIIVFFDDDFLPADDWIEAAVNVFVREPDVVGLTGHVVQDDIKGPGLSFDDAVRRLAQPDIPPSWRYREPFSPYGCNMAFRASAVGSLRFDERLVLYGWLEDRDFGARLASRGGRLIKISQARGVHMGAKSGRVSGERLGYSQIVNPLYMLRKGSMTMSQVTDHVFRNMASNLLGSLKPEPFIDRRGRLRGNLMGWADILRGRLRPERAKDIGPPPQREG